MYIFKHTNKVFTYKIFSIDFELFIILNILIFYRNLRRQIGKIQENKIKIW